MAQTITSSTFTTTYKDDFRDSSGYYRILFNSGVSLQARELTQLQTIIDKQFERMGNNLFIDGAAIQAGGASTYNVQYIALQDLTNYPLPVDGDGNLDKDAIVGVNFTGLTSSNSFDVIDVIAVIDVIVFLALFKLWRPLLSLTVQEDIAAVEGININLVKSCFMLLLALVFAVAMKLIGALLITALLVIPASSARQLVNSPKHMAILASFFSGLSVFLGLYASLYYDWPTGPAIICMATGIFVVTWTVHQCARKER